MRYRFLSALAFMLAIVLSRASAQDGVRLSSDNHVLGLAPAYSIWCNKKSSVAIPMFCTNLIAQDVASLPDQAASWSFQRISSYSGGTSGFENAALRAINQTSSGNANYEDGLLSILNNHSALATGSENTAGRFVAQGRSDGAIWSLANETADYTGVANPKGARLGIEQIVSGNGGDNGLNRVGLDVVASRPNIGGYYSGSDMTLGVGIRLVGQVTDKGHARISRGLMFGFGASPTDFDTGIDLTNASFSSGGAALLLATGQHVSFSASNDRTLDFSSSHLNYRVSGSSKFQISDAGGTIAQAPLTQPLMTPASSHSDCAQGTIQADANYVYVCVAVNTWKRSALSDF